FSGRKGVIAQAIAALVVVSIAMHIVMEGPMPAWLPDQVAHLIGLTGPETPDPAPVPVLFPSHGIEAALIVERANELITVAAAALWMLPVSCKLQSYFFERHRVLLGFCL